jgi:A/G-specific adenine glycosylase
LLQALLQWYTGAARALPWRVANPNPYHIWISEVMSQQSTLKMMLPFFDRWMKKFPRLEDLASAEEEHVLKLWEGLGYYSRARNIHKAAKILSNRFPQSPEELAEIPGIGPYTAAAIASIAFDHPVLPIDGNVTRVLSRVYGVSDPLNKTEDAKKIRSLALQLSEDLPIGKRGSLAQAFMELGASLCKPRQQAKCFECPIRQHCHAYKSNVVELLPAEKKRPQMLSISRLLLVYRNSKGEVLLRKRPSGLVLGGQWEIPFLDLESSEDWIARELSKSFELAKPFSHTIMNKKYRIWPVELGQIESRLPPEHAWLRTAFPGVLSTVTRKFSGISG